LEFVSGLIPSDLVVLEGVNQSIGLVHLLTSFGGCISELLLFINLVIVASSKLCFNRIDFIELSLCLGKLLLRLL
jgi:hypothetical protein